MPLLVRPRCFENESIIWYLARVAEVNGFKHLFHLLSFIQKKTITVISFDFLKLGDETLQRFLENDLQLNKEDYENMFLPSKYEEEDKRYLLRYCPCCLKLKGWGALHNHIQLFSFCPEHEVNYEHLDTFRLSLTEIKRLNLKNNRLPIKPYIKKGGSLVFDGSEQAPVTSVWEIFHYGDEIVKKETVTADNIKCEIWFYEKIIKSFRVLNLGVFGFLRFDEVVVLKNIFDKMYDKFIRELRIVTGLPFLELYSWEGFSKSMVIDIEMGLKLLIKRLIELGFSSSDSLTIMFTHFIFPLASTNLSNVEVVYPLHSRNLMHGLSDFLWYERNVFPDISLDSNEKDFIKHHIPDNIIELVVMKLFYDVDIDCFYTRFFVKESGVENMGLLRDRIVAGYVQINGVEYYKKYIDDSSYFCGRLTNIPLDQPFNYSERIMDSFCVSEREDEKLPA
ncbi:hypothetical protein [Endozoicomonas elysicola]|uniref:Uncharacterized protein n=1 Tax=Endozoicomonas elysicola TaxID=305900 RepID=A0A081KFP4_9GAMM|nr:hypothetical protein [Endozoicomonas elysicola]KEI72970.1 hypothetical protein GV64_21610 [Endozoicomonas elysicola]